MRTPLLLLLLAAPSAAQWASLPWDSYNPIEMGRQLVWHQNFSGTHVFSAHGQRWSNVGGPSAVVQGFGDWTLLVQEGSKLRAYSARHDATSELPPGTFPGIVIVEDDVIFVHDTSDTENPSVWGYSAQTNAWVEQQLSNQVTPGEIASSRFVIGVKDEVDYYGFSARTGQWHSFSIDQSGKQPEADGNVVVCDLFDPFSVGGIRKVAAFSGVTGTWDLSPLYQESTGVLLDHNVAAVSAESDVGSIAATAFSAYSGRWIVSTTGHPTGALTYLTGDNWVSASDGSGGAREAFGAAPGLDWTQLLGTWSDYEMDARDYFLLSNASDTEVLGFSGLVDSGYDAQVAPGGFTALGNNPPQSYAILKDDVAQYHAYAPDVGAWVVDNPGSFGNEFGGDAVFALRSSIFLPRMFSTRSASWTPGPQLQATSLLLAVGGTIGLIQEQSGPASTTVHVFDERHTDWYQFSTGYKATVSSGYNVALVHPTPGFGSLGEVYGLSSLSGAVSTPPLGAVTLPIHSSTGVHAEGDVAYFVDSAGLLWAYGGVDAGHLWHQWPSDTEYHVGGPAFSVRFGVRAEPGQVVLAFISPFPEVPAISFPGLGGLLGLNPTFAVSLGSMGTVGPDGIVSRAYQLAPGTLPRGVELYVQPVVLDFTTFGAHFAGRESRAWLF